jgi:hypothetical protein
MSLWTLPRLLSFVLSLSLWLVGSGCTLGPPTEAVASDTTLAETAATPTPLPTATSWPTATLWPTATATTEPTLEPTATATAEPTAVYTPDPTPETAVTIRRPIPQSDIPVRLEPVAQGLTAPVALAAPPDQSGRLFIVEQTGLIQIVDAAGELHDEPFLDLSERPGEHSLIGLAFHPNFAQNGRFYLLYNIPLSDEVQDYTSYLAQFTTEGPNANTADPHSAQIIAQWERPQAQPNGSRLKLLAEDRLAVLLTGVGGDEEQEAQCFNIALVDAPAVPCPANDLINSHLSQALTAYAELTPVAVDGSEPFPVSGRVYQGMAFPSFREEVILGAGDGTRAGSRLLLARPPRLEGNRWALAELVVANRENGRLSEFIVAIDQDTAGELYLLTVAGAETAAVGNVYKVVPHIEKERQLIEDPTEYLPLPHRYARVVRPAAIYHTLAAVRANQPFGTHGGGSYWVTIHNQSQVDGQTYYHARWAWGAAGWISGRDLSFNAPLSHLRGIDLRHWDGRPLALVHNQVYVRSLPGVIEEEMIIGYLEPYDLVPVWETRQVGDTVWYRIGPDQWSHSGYLRVLVPSPRPQRIGASDQWVEVNLQQQVVIAYEGDRPVFATLTSTGRRGYATEQGLFRSWVKVRDGPMQWEDASQPYSLASVPWIIYFNRDQGLHGAYWHNLFGSVRSAGCVNLSPHDAHWLFHWAEPQLASGERLKHLTQENPGPWVWVHNNPPDLNALIAAYKLESMDRPGIQMN